METSIKGKVMTVLGPVDPALLGRTLTHEHLPFHYEGQGLFTGKIPDSVMDLSESPLQMENLWWIRQYPYLHRSNNEFGCPEVQKAVLSELDFFKVNGGGTIVDNSTPGIHRIPEFIRKAAMDSGVHIVTGTGYYVDGSQSESRLKLTIEEMATFMKNELTEGFDGSGMRCGIIGEIGTSWPVTDFERRSLKASGKVQEELGCPVNIHPGRHPDSPAEAVRIFLEAGGKSEKTVISHLERTIMEDEALLEFLSCGVFCEFDLFGTEVSHYVLNPDLDMPSDAQRISRLRNLLDNDMQDRIVIGHDIHTRHRLMKYGGHGFSHILLNVVPKMLTRDFTQDQVDKILVQNPAKWLTY